MHIKSYWGNCFPALKFFKMQEYKEKRVSFEVVREKKCVLFVSTINTILTKSKSNKVLKFRYRPEISSKCAANREKVQNVPQAEKGSEP